MSNFVLMWGRARAGVERACMQASALSSGGGSALPLTASGTAYAGAFHCANFGERE